MHKPSQRRDVRMDEHEEKIKRGCATQNVLIHLFEYGIIYLAPTKYVLHVRGSSVIPTLHLGRFSFFPFSSLDFWPVNESLYFPKFV